MIAPATSTDRLLRTACPLQHPDNFSVTVRGRTYQLYDAGDLIIMGERFPVVHEWIPNAEARFKLRKDLETNLPKREQFLWAMSRACPQAFILWLNWFAFAYVQKEVDASTGRERALSGRECVRPFASWPCQDRVACELYTAITEGFDCTADKSRQMGATWLICAMILWFVLFQENTHFSVMSRIEDLVDNPGDPQSIFWKIMFMADALPPWMRMGLDKKRLRLVNHANGSTIMGRSTTGEQGRGGAVTAAFIDEASQIDQLEAIWTSFGQSTACRIANSTPYGAGFFSKLVRNPAVYKITLPWWEHPLKGRGREVKTDPNNGEVCIVSPFYIAQCRRASPDPENWWLGRKTREVAQELDMDHTGSGRLVFDYPVLSRQLALCPPHPVYRGELRITCDRLHRVSAVRKGEVEHIDFEEDGAGGRGKWELWCGLEPDEDGFERPNQRKTYVLFCDIAQGVGASESTLVVYCLEEQRKVAQYRDAQISPVRFALLACAAGWWFGGPRGFAFLGWEANGFGQAFGRTCVKLRYPWLLSEVDESGRGSKVKSRLGWTSTRTSKRTIFELLRSAMASGEFNDPSRASIEQMLEVVHFDNGGLGVASTEHISEDARALHADIVTANAGAYWMSTRIGMIRPSEADPPPHSPAWRRKHAERIVRRAGGLRRERKALERPNPFR